MKVATILGTRPELIRLSEIIKKLDKFTDHVFIHTGQNFDYELNEVFFKDLDIRKPDYVMQSGADTVFKQVAIILEETEKILAKENIEKNMSSIFFASKARAKGP